MAEILLAVMSLNKNICTKLKGILNLKICKAVGISHKRQSISMLLSTAPSRLLSLPLPIAEEDKSAGEEEGCDGK